MKIYKPHNPFLLAGYYSPEYFCDREAETAKILSALENDRNISLMSPRRFGKTGLIHHVFHQLSQKDKNAVCIYLDIYSIQNLTDFVKLFAESVLGKMDDSVDKSLQEVFSYLKQSNKRCYIAIDEFQQVADYPEKGTEALLRSYIQFLPNVKFIFSGSRQHLMSENQSTQIMSLDVVNKDKYEQFATNHFQKNRFSIKHDCFDFIYTRFEGHTWYVQAVLNRLYEYRKNIDKLDIVYYAIGELLEENTYAYQELLNAYSDVQVNLLRAVAKEKVVAQINSGEFISKYSLKNSSSVSRALNKLMENELVYKSEKGYIVYDRFLGAWLST